MLILSLFYNILLVLMTNPHKSHSSSLCGSKSDAYCLDSKKYYSCSETDKYILEHELGNDTAKQAIYLFGKMETGHDDCNIHVCETGFCDDVEGVCNTNIKGISPDTIPCGQCTETYACTSLTTFKYCENFTMQGDAHIQCPKGHICHYNQATDIKSPCEEIDIVNCHPLMSCYAELDIDAKIIEDYTEFCMKHGNGVFYLPDAKDCQSVLWCDNDATPTFHVDSSYDMSYDIHSKKWIPTSNFACPIELCSRLGRGSIPNFNQNDCKSFISCNASDTIRILDCGLDENGDALYFDPIEEKCTKSYECSHATHSDFVDICKNIGSGLKSIITDLKCQSYINCNDSPYDYQIQYCSPNKTFQDVVSSCVTNEAMQCPNKLLLSYCENKSGRFKVPTDVNCTSYIECHENNKFLTKPMICAENKKFNPDTEECEAGYECLDVEGSLDKYCPEGFYGNLSDPVNQNGKYYINCRENGPALRLACPTGTLFNSNLRKCKFRLGSAKEKTSMQILNHQTQVAPEPEPDYQNKESICKHKGNGTKFADCSDTSCKKYIECSISDDQKITYKSGCCPSHQIYCESLSSCVNNTQQHTLCPHLSIPKQPVMYLPPNPFTFYYHWRAIDYRKTCESLLEQENQTQLAIPNPFTRIQFIICKKEEITDEMGEKKIVILWKTQTCCQNYVFCMNEGKCMPSDIYSYNCGGKQVHYFTFNPIKLNLNEFHMYNDAIY